MIPYILYASIILAASFVFYKLLLQNETFFYLNRLVLLTCMLLAFILPVLKVPQQISFRQPTVTTVTEQVQPASVLQNSLKATAPGNTTVSVKERSGQSINFGQVRVWLFYLYWFGVAVFGLNFLIQVVALLYRAYTRPVILDGRFRIVEVSGDKAPCSFGNNIFINPEKYDWETYNQVLLHEKIHIEQKHTLDLLLAEVLLVFQWFNPFAWLWRRELEKNLEFFTDNKLLQHNDVEKETYQFSLLKVAAPYFPLSITTNYNQSLLKQRVLMMNAKKSSMHTMWKYFFLLPLMVTFVCLFNEPLAVSQGIAVPKPKQMPVPHGIPGMKSEGSWFATIKNDTINMQFKSDDEYNSSNGHVFLLSEFKDLPREKQGKFSLVREAGTMEFEGKFEGNRGMGSYKFIPDRNYSSEMQKDGIEISEDRDLMVFFLVNINRSYVAMLKRNGFTDLDKDKLIPLAALDVNEAYIKSIREAGFPDIDLDKLVPFRALKIDKAYIEDIHSAGYKNAGPDKIITFKAQGIDSRYIADFRNSKQNSANKSNTGDNNRNNNNSRNKNLNKDKNKNLNENLNNEENKDEDDDDLVAFKAMNIDKAYINSLKEAGYDNLSNSDLISMKALNVTPEYIQSLRNAGYSNIKPGDLVSLRSQQVTPEVIKEYKELGFDKLDLNDLVGARATGTSPSFIKSMKAKGHNLNSLDKYVALKSVLGNEN